MSDRFFFPGPLGIGEVTLEGPEAHHLANVRRFGIGDAVTLFNGDGHEYLASVVEIGKKRVVLQVIKVESPNRELPFTLHIASALPKGDRGDFLIEKLTELGVTDVTPLIADRSVVKAGDAKIDKLQRAVIEASKQCGRNVLLRVHPPAHWTEWCVRQSGRRFIADPKGATNRQLNREDVIVAIGPEGGFAPQELQAATLAGWETLSLGPRILRIETAAFVAAAILARPEC